MRPFQSHKLDFRSQKWKEIATSDFDVSGHTSSLRGVRNDISAPLKVAGLRVTVPMNTQEPAVTETRSAVDVSAADETGVCESTIMPVVRNDNFASQSPIAVAIESGDSSPALTSPQESGHSVDTQRELHGATSSQNVSRGDE
ncbi:hypothetical protein V6N13_047803 [Hibiscus sabdariffa]